MFNKLIKHLRKQRKLTQSGLAEKVGVGWNHIARIEAGIARPSMELLEKILAELQFDPIIFGGPVETTNERDQMLASIVSYIEYWPLEELERVYNVIRLLHPAVSSKSTKSGERPKKKSASPL